MNDTKNEKWLPVSGYSGHYEASSYGRVRSIKKPPHIILADYSNGSGYRKLTLWLKGSPMNKYVHSTVAESFFGPRPTGFQCCHLNGDKNDNRLINLKWASPKENQSHREIHGTGRLGVKRSTKAYSLEKVEDLRVRFKMSGVSITKFAAREGMPRTTLSDIINFRTWQAKRFRK